MIASQRSNSPRWKASYHSRVIVMVSVSVALIGSPLVKCLGSGRAGPNPELRCNRVECRQQVPPLDADGPGSLLPFEGETKEGAAISLDVDHLLQGLEIDVLAEPESDRVLLPIDAADARSQTGVTGPLLPQPLLVEAAADHYRKGVLLSLDERTLGLKVSSRSRMEAALDVHSPYSIGELARCSRTPATTIRYYEREGLLPVPERRNGRRRYDNEAEQRLAAIALAKQAGFSIREIKR